MFLSPHRDGLWRSIDGGWVGTGRARNCGCTLRSAHDFPGIVRQPAKRSWLLFRRSRPSLCSRANFPAAPRTRSTPPRVAGHDSCGSGPMATQRTMKRTLMGFAASPRRSSTLVGVRSPRSAFQAIPGKSQSNGFRCWGWLPGRLRTECQDGLAIRACEGSEFHLEKCGHGSTQSCNYKTSYASG